MSAVDLLCATIPEIIESFVILTCNSFAGAIIVQLVFVLQTNNDAVKSSGVFVIRHN